ncbi:MAG: FAD:protein FMN transferase [Bacteroidota bacterium]
MTYNQYIILALLLLAFGCGSNVVVEEVFEEKSYTVDAIKMGSAFAITVVAADSVFAVASIEKAYTEIDRIENLISSWNPDSETSRVNDMAGIESVIVSEELFLLIERAMKVSALTGGAFDISYASMDRIWKFDGSLTEMPEQEAIEQSVAKVNYQDIELNDATHSVFLKNEGMKIGFGGIGKGYAGNKAKSLLLSLGVTSGVVNAGGDLIAWGQKPNGQTWDVAIADPVNPKRSMGWLAINDGAVVTSGNYERFAMIDGVRYAHIINPKTGIPVRDLKSVTILCPDAELADALATGVFVLGKQVGLELINKVKQVEGLLITSENEILSSKGLSLNYYENE